VIGVTTGCNATRCFYSHASAGNLNRAAWATTSPRARPEIIGPKHGLIQNILGHATMLARLEDKPRPGLKCWLYGPPERKKPVNSRNWPVYHVQQAAAPSCGPISELHT
jgi:hypothetical protein